jgi:CheY-like chemotaxis protein
LKSMTPPPGAPIRVLLVEDELGLCELAGLWLRSLGYEVVAANSTEEALECLADGHFDVLFSDVMMPGGMDGIGLAHQVVSKRPEMKVLLTSGDANELRAKQVLPWVILGKPYRMADLGAALRALTIASPAA